MRKTIAALALMAAMAAPARAQTPVTMSLSSATWCYISVSTFQPTRVDNYNGGCEGLMEGRTTLLIVNSTVTLYGAFSTALSTQPTSRLGDSWAPGDRREQGLSSAMAYYLMSAATGTAPKVLVQQGRAYKTSTTVTGSP